MPIAVLVLLAAVAEVAVLVTVGGLIGLLPTILLLLGGTALGAWLLRREGTRTVAALRESVLLRRPPERELVDGVLLAAAGVLVFLPGFLSDLVALFLLLPPTRALVRERVLRRARARAGRPVVVDSIVVESERVRPEPQRVIVIPPARPE